MTGCNLEAILQGITARDATTATSFILLPILLIRAGVLLTVLLARLPYPIP
jgi:hypothetical protein